MGYLWQHFHLYSLIVLISHVFCKKLNLVLIWRNDLLISLKITCTGFLVLIWKLRKAWESGSILWQFIWTQNIMKPQMFSILNILMKKQRLKGTGKLYFLTMSCSLHFFYRNMYLFSRILGSKFAIAYVLISSGLNFHSPGAFQ